MGLCMDFDDILRYYMNPLVKKEIVDYSNKRWIAIHTLSTPEGSVFVRYWGKNGPPLCIENEETFDGLIKRFYGLKPRTFYASANVYAQIKERDDVENIENIRYTTPVWDIDGSLEFVDKIIDVARVIIEILEKEGVTKSVYLKWSGRGIHVQLHERAISQEILSKYHPLDIAYSIVEYVLKRSIDKVTEIAKKAIGGDRSLKVENEIDLKRVFTVPLSLHKSLDYAVVCFKPNEIDDFSLEWAKPDVLKHNPNWREFAEGEADNLAVLAMKEIGGYFNKVGDIRTVVGKQTVAVQKAKPIRKITTRKIGRFPIMALLQAARYYLLTKDIKKAKSFGLNRAIFYAWAKYHGRERIMRRKITGREKDVEITSKDGKKIVYVGDEGAYVTDDGWFIIGDRAQLPDDYDREIVSKINSVIPYDKAWEKAIEYLKKFPKSYLLDQRKFFSEVYKKVRDDFLEKVVEEKDKRKQKTLFDF